MLIPFHHNQFRVVPDFFTFHQSERNNESIGEMKDVWTYDVWTL